VALVVEFVREANELGRARGEAVKQHDGTRPDLAMKQQFGTPGFANVRTIATAEAVEETLGGVREA
jgi:hypothetical protein